MTGPRHQAGQAAVELALVLPLVSLLLLGAVQLALIVQDQVMVTHAAREAARQAAVDSSPDAPRRAALAGSSLEPARLRVEVTTMAPDRVAATLVYVSLTRVPLVGPLVPDVELGARASMRNEQSLG